MTSAEPTTLSPPAPPGLIRRTLRRRWVPLLTQWSILTVALLSAAFVTIKPVYRTSCLIRVEPVRSSSPLHDGGEQIEQFLQTQVHLIMSHDVLKAAAANPAAAKLPRIATSTDAVSDLRRDTQVAILPGTFLIEVAMLSKNPTEAAILVDAVVDSYMETNHVWTDGKTRMQIKSLEVYLAELNNQVEKCDQKWKDLVKEFNRVGGEAAPKGLLAKDRQTRLEQKLFDNDIRRIEIQSRLDFLQPRKDLKDLEVIAALADELQALNFVDANLREKLDQIRIMDRPETSLEVDITLVKEKREATKVMMEEVKRRLEQLKFASNHEPRVRSLSPANTPGRPISDGGRLKVMAIIPLATFVVLFGLFMVVEARSSWAVPPVALASD